METQNKLEIHHVAKRLPYGLKIQTIDLYDGDPIFELSATEKAKTVSVTSLIDFQNEYYKPILFPLSYLTETITIKGESFVPIRKLLEEYCFNLERMTDDEINSYAESMVEIGISMKVAEMLMSWHFELPDENLIEKGLAISVSDLEQNPYA